MGKISDTINSMVQRMLESAEWTSANPTHVNTLIQVNQLENPDFESDIKKIIQEETKKDFNSKPDIDKKTQEKIDKTSEKVTMFEKGNIGDIQKMSSEQFGNIKSFSTDPFGFVTRTLLRKLRTGLGIAFIVTIAIEVAKFLILEMFKPGRPFDIRFRETIDNQLVKFLERKEQQELKQGFKSLITTTIGGLRGNSLRGQVGGNFYTPSRIPNGFIDPSFIVVSNFNAQDNRKKSFQDVGAGASRGKRNR